MGAVATSTSLSSESDDISFVLGVGTTVADSTGKGMEEAEVGAVATSTPSSLESDDI